MTGERLRRRLELRRSNAAQPHRNRHRERQTGQEQLDEPCPVDGHPCPCARRYRCR
ncbi:hypothetical protein SEA_BOOSTSEASON_90 [Mycobacterium phage BoostSeason]|uniref:Uncharacterized protein n=3 Tax=Timquatrovirus TaxID=1623306 RepID=Q9ZWZ2_BPMT4|nr:hypothetical protein TM4_gp88 [Mycobacterium phage TM4]YP_009032482.1 hypothetical protein PBI_ZOEJ_88 [Mycobacterium phage ZoeJ]YP_009195336.1 hypothetical protein SEA_MUFASA_90 [Mycobacterium phage Mufasa]AYN57263.1 hypothetical protein SEA_BOOSTSEASON_90 [Mycobacterium phage BoostSeason]AAD17653.1 hypothetical protein TM4_88 [Mycobacterium phage TM4]AHY26912.1 hypothetical protein PBI_ZOEJ_88 [Mycobacterium phage ZoeJ]ALF00524.1 hypothetical protein SEA_MUFASA_90 [Mycobacterium phage Mu